MFKCCACCPSGCSEKDAHPFPCHVHKQNWPKVKSEAKNKIEEKGEV